MPQIVLVFCLLPIFIQFACGIFLYALRGNKLPQILMVACNIITAATLGASTIAAYYSPFYLRMLWNPLHLFGLLVAFPLIYFYLFCLMNPSKLTKKHWIVFYLPTGILLISFTICRWLCGAIPVFIDYSGFSALWYKPEIWIRFTAMLLVFTEITATTFLLVKMLIIHKRNLISNFSYIEDVRLNWVIWILMLLFLYGLLTLLAVVCTGPLIKSILILVLIIEPVITTVLILRQKDLYQYPAKNTEISIMLLETPSKHELLKSKLLELFEKDEIFKDAELNSEKLRQMLFTNRTYLSQLINQDFGTNFYNFINGYRLKKAEEIMKNDLYKNIPLKNIAEICGFKNLSAFSTFFKQTYNISPTEWRKNLNSPSK